MVDNLNELSNRKEYRPVLASRRGEASAWVFFGILLTTAAVLHLTNPPVSPAILILVLFFLMIALAISLGNWMDRKTRIFVSDEIIFYRNGLRKVSLRWHQIKEIQLYKDRLGEKALIIGETGHFHVRLFGEVRYKGEQRDEFGFRDGEEILKIISERSSVEPVRVD